MSETEDLDKYIGWTGTLPQGWVQLPLDPGVDAVAWATAYQAEASVGVEWEEGEAGPDVVVAMLARFTELVRTRLDPRTAAPLALAFVPNIMDRVLAVLTAAAFPDSVDEPLLETGDDAGIGNLDASRVDLPWGPTLRVRRIEPDDPADDLRDGGGWRDAPLSERITYLTTPPGLDGFTVVEAMWSDLVLGDAITEHVDALVASLQLEFRQ